VRRDVAIGEIDNPFVWVEMRCRAHATAARDAAADSEVVGVMRDIGERKAQTQALEAARARAEHADAAKGQFLATVTHELRTPLNVIIGFSEMLAKDGPVPLDAARRRDYAQLINESGQHLLSVVNGILDMSKIESGNFAIAPEPVALDAAIARCCDLMTLKAGEDGIALTRRIAPELPELLADKRALNQILLNLLSNALKFTPRGGKVTVSATVECDAALVIIEDTGVGIAVDDLPRLGEPFFQARTAYDRRHDGTGLGLSIVKGLVALHGGSFDVSSRVGLGTTVAVRLPLDCGRPRHNGARASAEASRVVRLTTATSTGAPVRKIA
jgi:cell cycle sensor histidine kinase DivJ